VATTKSITIVGAGPAGLAAAITAARGGARVVVHERRPAVGARFHGDFQGLENWTTEEDALDELRSFGIEPSFYHTPSSRLVVFDPAGGEVSTASRRPLFYQVRRGSDRSSLDSALREQAEALGVEICFNDPCLTLPAGGIVAHGPRRADAVAIGYVFETEATDGAFLAISDALAPKGYAYLLIHDGRGTVASCIFDDFHREKTYLERTVEFFSARAGLRMRERRRFGGLGNVAYPATARKGNILFAGESAGFQDALAGFGMRYAMTSGHLAARAILEGRPEAYDHAWKQRLGRSIRAGIVNRYVYERVGARACAFLVRKLARGLDVGHVLHGLYAGSWWHALVYPLARRSRVIGSPVLPCVRDDCACTWCACHREAA
jgi:flavin-dependent dehydrogenase